jgi:hypothetical protein
MRTRAGGCCAPEAICINSARGGGPLCCPAGSRCLDGQCRDQRSYAWLSNCDKDKLVGHGGGGCGRGRRGGLERREHARAAAAMALGCSPWSGEAGRAAAPARSRCVP